MWSNSTVEMMSAWPRGQYHTAYVRGKDCLFSGEPSVISSTSPLSPKHLQHSDLVANPIHRSSSTYWVNFQVGELASLSTILVGSDSRDQVAQAAGVTRYSGTGGQ